MKVFIFGSLALLTAILLTELILRLLLGFGNPPLYIADDDIGYLLAPNQRVRRLGNLIIINQYSMRTEAIEKSPAANTLRVFLMGDSIVNGNWWTDQSETLSTRIENELSQPDQPSAEVLNASANSWGPRNQIAYLQKFGIFESHIVMLVINTDDLFGTQPSPLQVGKDRSYPDKKPLLALLELTNRLKKQPPIPGLKEIHNESGDRVGKNLLAIEDIEKYVTTHDAQLLLAMTPLKREVLHGPKDYEVVARQRVNDLVAQQQIPYVDFLTAFQGTPDPEGLYRDHIHLSPTGNSLVTQSLTDLIRQSRPTPP